MTPRALQIRQYSTQRYLAIPFAGQLYNPYLDASNVGSNYKRLGELYENKGDRVKAAEYYTKFVRLWKDADPDLQPAVADVKRRLAKLTGEPCISASAIRQ